MERKPQSTHPAIVATNISPSASGFKGALSYSASAAMLKAPQNIAMEVPAGMQPDPTTSPRVSVLQAYDIGTIGCAIHGLRHADDGA